MSGTVLELRDVRTHFALRKGLLLPRQTGVVKAVDGVSLRLERGGILGLVGESGCGKSTLARTIVRLVEPSAGAIYFEGRDLAALSKRELRAIRPRMQLVFQDPYASLNPRMTVYDALAEPLRVHRLARRGELPERVAALMDQVGLARRYIRKYPHEFSGGQRQRIAIARALALEPTLILADEPVSALDVSVQAQILNLIADLSAGSDLTLLLVSHDLSVVHHLSDRIAVMYLGKVVELGPAGEVYNRPRHPYTRMLIRAIPVPDPVQARARRGTVARGDAPSPVNPPPGCAFHPRCPFAIDACRQAPPPLVHCGEGHEAACIRLDAVAQAPPVPAPAVENRGQSR